MARRPRIAVVGSANIDLTTFTDRFPKPGETIFGQKFDLGFGGKGANQAVAARLCGADVFMVARVGSDLFGPATIENFKKLGIDTTHVKQIEGLSSGVAPIFVEPNGQNRILVVKGANDALKPADVDAAAEMLKTVDCIVLQFEIPLETVYYTVAFARKHGIRCILNPAPVQPVDMRALADLDYFVPNESEAETITGVAGTECRRREEMRGELGGGRYSPRDHYAGSERITSRGPRSERACASVCGEKHGQHWRRRRIHRELLLYFWRRECRSERRCGAPICTRDFRRPASERKNPFMIARVLMRSGRFEGERLKLAVVICRTSMLVHRVRRCCLVFSSCAKTVNEAAANLLPATENS